MRTILSLRRHQYLKRVGIFLIAIALIVGIVSCNGDGVTYDLTMAENPAAGGTATDETGGAPYEEGTDVDIKAVPADCYRFVSWSAPAGTIGNSTAAETTFTMPDQDVTVTANFEITPLDHFKFYWVDEETAPDIGKDVQLKDQFGAINATVGEAWAFGNPVEKVHGNVTMPISDPDRHYTLYGLDLEEEPQSWRVTVNNQFGDNQELTVWGPVALAVPTQKEDHQAPVCLDHFLVYEVLPSSWLEHEDPIAVVDLHDQFQDELAAEPWDPVYFATPVQKTYKGEVTEVVNEDEHMVFYYIDGASFEKKVQIVNQFGEQTLDLIFRDTLAVPSQKIDWWPSLDHFKSYWVDKMSPIGEVVQLKDQFVTITANVTDPVLFANPVEKWLSEFERTPIWDPRDHLMFYGIDILAGEEGMWEVTVDNQFGSGQLLKVSGPIMVIVPTEKLPHGPPEDLNHFLVYEVVDWDIPPMPGVYLWDQFTPFDPEWNEVGSPMLFAVPAHKTVLGGAPTPIIGDEHLLFYGIDGGLGFWEPIVHNQFFGPGPIPVYQGDGDRFLPFDLLAVPSAKLYWESGGGDQ